MYIILYYYVPPRNSYQGCGSGYGQFRIRSDQDTVRSGSGQIRIRSDQDPVRSGSSRIQMFFNKSNTIS